MIYTTLNKIRDKRPCAEGWAKLLKSLDKKEADDEPLSLETILDSNGIEDALWATRTMPEHSKKWRPCQTPRRKPSYPLTAIWIRMLKVPAYERPSPFRTIRS